MDSNDTWSGPRASPSPDRMDYSSTGTPVTLSVDGFDSIASTTHISADNAGVLPTASLTEGSQHDPSGLASPVQRVHTYNPRQGKSAVRLRPIATPSTSMPNVPTIPIPIPANPNVIPGNNLPSAPASPPTPAPSPTPMQRAPDWSTADPREDIGDIELDVPVQQRAEVRQSAGSSSGRGYPFGYRHMRAAFAEMDNDERQRMLAELLNMCDGKLLGFVANFVGPRLKRDPFSVLPNELCLRILTFIEDARTLARSSQVSRRWRELVSDDMAWKSLCERHAYYRRMSDDPLVSSPRPIPSVAAHASLDQRYAHPYGYQGYAHAQIPLLPTLSASVPDLTRHPNINSNPSVFTSNFATQPRASSSMRRPKAISYRSHFKQKYQVETAWRHGGKVDTRQITPDQGVVTSLHLTSNYIIVALDNAKIHVFDTDGRHLRCLQGHMMGVWAMVPYGDTLVSGGCDRDVRVWDLTTGVAQHELRGHTSTVRCLKMSGPNIAISGSRDTTLRVWDIRKGICRHVLVGHQSSVRCLEIHGDLVVSGSYDTTARIWSISEGRCLRTLQGHFSQIYAVAFDGQRVATGSLDTSVRVWDPRDGRCIAQLQGHTSLVGQLQLRNDTLVTGGSDGSVRVWSLQTYSAIHRLAAHDNSVTSLQFDDSRIVSGGSDGRVKVWDLQRGSLVRELGSPADAVWRVVFEDEKAVVLATRGGKTAMEVWSFAPPPDTDELQLSSYNTPTSTPRSASANGSSMNILPYQDPIYGDRPSYKRLDTADYGKAGENSTRSNDGQSSSDPSSRLANHAVDERTHLLSTSSAAASSSTSHSLPHPAATSSQDHPHPHNPHSSSTYPSHPVDPQQARIYDSMLDHESNLLPSHAAPIDHSGYEIITGHHAIDEGMMDRQSD